MPAPLRQTIDAANARIDASLGDMRRALAGQTDFGAAQVRALSEPLREMAPIVAHAAELRGREPEIAAQLDRYKSRLRELQTTLDQVHLMLLTRRAQLQARRGQLDAVSHWACALRQTQ